MAALGREGKVWGKWSGQAQIGVESTFGTMSTDLKSITLADEPDINPGVPALSRASSYGRTSSQQFHDDNEPGLYVPSLRFSFVPNEALFSLVLTSLFQDGSTHTGASDPYTNTLIPYAEGCSPATYKGFTFKKVYQPTAGSLAYNSHIAVGCITKSVTITAEKGKQIRCEVEALPLSAGMYSDVAAVGTYLTGHASYFWTLADTVKWCALGGALAAISPPAMGWTLKMDNNAEYLDLNLRAPWLQVLGELAVSGSLTLSQRGDAGTFLANIEIGAQNHLQLLYNTQGAAGAFQAICDAEWGASPTPKAASHTPTRPVTRAHASAA